MKKKTAFTKKKKKKKKKTLFLFFFRVNKGFAKLYPMKKNRLCIAKKLNFGIQ